MKNLPSKERDILEEAGQAVGVGTMLDEAVSWELAHHLLLS